MASPSRRAMACNLAGVHGDDQKLAIRGGTKVAKTAVTLWKADVSYDLVV